jgi:hypothetical protein
LFPGVAKSWYASWSFFGHLHGKTFMIIPASKVRSLCTSSEIALVSASRKPELDQLSHAEVKRLAVRARKLFDKWQGLGRSQSRDRRRQSGSSDLDANTQLKAQIFREALENFEARLANPATSVAPAVRTTRPKTKKSRSGGHRTARAAIRKGMTAVEDVLNTGNAENKSPAAAPVTKPKSPSSAVPKKRKPVVAQPEASPPKKAVPPAKRRIRPTGVGASKQRDATAAAKKSRLVRSGTTTRMLGHISSRGKRSQARRDVKQ